MTTDPNDLLKRLRANIAGRNGDAVVSATVMEVQHLLAMLDHQQDQIKALQQLAARPVAPAGSNGQSAPTESICQEADRITGGERQASYGHPVYNFTRTARMWEVILDRPAGEITPSQVGLCMIAVKLARQLHKPKRDNLTDVCGFAKTVQMCEEFDVNDQP